jgi:hypothetical protein
MRAWEGDHGHAHAALRYGMLTRPGRSVETERIAVPETPEEARASVLRGAEDRIVASFQTGSWN